MVIDEEGNNLGAMKTDQAMRLAHEQDLDLIEVSPVAQPPVCRIMNLGKWQYLQSQKQKKQKTLETKILRLSFKIAEHDRQVRIKQAVKFLDKGHKVRLDMRLKGREKAYPEQGKELLAKFISDMPIPVIQEGEISRQGANIGALIAKKH